MTLHIQNGIILYGALLPLQQVERLAVRPRVARRHHLSTARRRITLQQRRVT